MGALETTDAECAAGRTAPRVSLDDIKAAIAAQYTFTGAQAVAGCPDHPSLAVLTICLVVMQNGFTIIGKSAPASADNFDPDLGAKLAYEDAVRQIWPLMGYALRDRLHQASLPPPTEPRGWIGDPDNLDATEQPSGYEPSPAFDPALGMVRHIGTKIVDATPMTRAEYNTLRGWSLPADENGEDAGYLVEYTDAVRPNVEGYRGYVSWSPLDVFNQAYRPL